MGGCVALTVIRTGYVGGVGSCHRGAGFRGRFGVTIGVGSSPTVTNLQYIEKGVAPDVPLIWTVEDRPVLLHRGFVEHKPFCARRKGKGRAQRWYKCP